MRLGLDDSPRGAAQIRRPRRHPRAGKSPPFEVAILSVEPHWRQVALAAECLDRAAHEHLPEAVAEPAKRQRPVADKCHARASSNGSTQQPSVKAAVEWSTPRGFFRASLRTCQQQAAFRVCMILGIDVVLVDLELGNPGPPRNTQFGLLRTCVLGVRQRLTTPAQPNIRFPESDATLDSTPSSTHHACRLLGVRVRMASSDGCCPRWLARILGLVVGAVGRHSGGRIASAGEGLGWDDEDAPGPRELAERELAGRPRAPRLARLHACRQRGFAASRIGMAADGRNLFRCSALFLTRLPHHTGSQCRSAGLA